MEYDLPSLSRAFGGEYDAEWDDDAVILPSGIAPLSIPNGPMVHAGPEISQ